MLRRHVPVLKVLIGLTTIGLSGFNFAMQFSGNEILIGVTLAISGGAGVACLPLLNELIVETTYPAGEATTTGLSAWLSGPLTGALVAISTLIPYSDTRDFPDSVCREGETQDLSWFLSIMIGLLGLYCLVFAYFYRKFNHCYSINYLQLIW